MSRAGQEHWLAGRLSAADGPTNRATCSTVRYMKVVRQETPAEQEARQDILLPRMLPENWEACSTVRVQRSSIGRTLSCCEVSSEIVRRAARLVT